MKYTLFLTAAALSAALVQPLEAKPHDDGGDGQGGGGGNARSAPARQGENPGHPRSAPHAQFTPRSSGPMGPSMITHNGSFQSRSFNGPVHHQPTIAFGGGAVNNNERNMNLETNRRFGNSQTFAHSNGSRFGHPSAEVSRGWDHGSIHTWNHHHYRWFNNDWVIIDNDFGYGDYGYGYGVPYDSYYETDTAVPYEYSLSDGLTAAVQRELSRRGYNTGGVDGIIGPQTRDAIANFQGDEGLAITGRIDRSLLRDLGLR